MSAPEPRAVIRPSVRPRRTPVRLRLLMLGLAVISLVLWGVVLGGPAPRPLYPVWITVALLLVGYLVAETAQLHLESKRQTFSVSMSELPMVVGLFLLPAGWVLVVRLAAYAVVAAVRRVALEKTVFNLLMFATEVGVAAAILEFLSAHNPLSPVGWAAAYIAVLAAALVGAIAVVLAIAVVQPPLVLREQLSMVRSTVLNAVFMTTLGLLVLVLVATSPWTGLGLLVLAAVLVVAYRRFGRLVSEHKDLGELYELTREVSTSVRGDGFDQDVLERVRRLMRAEVAQLWLADGEQLMAKPADAEPEQRQAAADLVRQRVLRGESVLAGPRSRESALRGALADRGARELVAVPLRVGGEVAGSLEVLDRQGERSRFLAADQALLETLAVHTGVALENMRLVDRLRHEAAHDPLTGLPNRRAFVERLDAALTGDQPPDALLAVLVLDLQSFKDVNDALGRAAGDRLLVEVASRIRSAVNDPATAARLSSDELGVFTPVPDLSAARSEAIRLQSVLASPIHVGGMDLRVGAVIGIAVYPEHGTDAVTLVQRADVAMYAAKRAPRGVLAYVPSMDAPSVRRFGLVSELRRTLEVGGLAVWYQPQVRLDRSELVGLEALVRWPHPEHGLIPPDEFIPVAEHTGLIGPLTSFVLSTALRDLRQWRARGHEFGMSVNISVRSLLDSGFVEEVRASLVAAGVPAPLLTLEITESEVMSDPARAVPVLETLREMGVRLSVDDFGIGHSSLTYLRRLPVSEVKIDRSFVRAMVDDPSDLAIVRAVVDLSEPLGLAVVAEGVESEETRQQLAEVGCGIIQGFLLSRPLPRPEMERWLARRTVAMSAGTPGPARWLRVLSG
jgi:diguanylate cyclase (GGDEF)-like protein